MASNAWLQSCVAASPKYGLLEVSTPLRRFNTTSAGAKFSDPQVAAKNDVNYRAPEIVAQRAALMAMLSLSNGNKVLDIGCGTGFLLEQIAAAVGPAGRAEGVEPAAAMRSLADQKIGSVPNVRVQGGNANRVPFEDGHFDVVVLVQVLLYVEDVLGALIEAKRVLRPGGRLIILDTDWDSVVVNTKQREVRIRMQEAFESQFHNAHLPPQLPGLLRKAGVVLDETRTIQMLASGAADSVADSWMAQWALEQMPNMASKAGVPAAEICAWIREQQLLIDTGSFFACVHRFVFLARKSV